MRRPDGVHDIIKGEKCVQAGRHSTDCCPSRSPGSVAAFLAGKDDCKDLNDADVDAYVARLRSCAPLYTSGILKLNGLVDEFSLRVHDNISAVVEEYDSCVYSNAAFESLDALLDQEYTSAVGTSTPRRLHFAKVMVPIVADLKNMMPVHEMLEKLVGSSFGGATLVAYRLDTLKNRLFEIECLNDDVPVMVISVLAILVGLAIFSGSFLFAVCAFGQIVLALVLAFAFYILILGLPFFPILALTGSFVCIGIGVDDIFFFLQAVDDSYRR